MRGAAAGRRRPPTHGGPLRCSREGRVLGLPSGRRVAVALVAGVVAAGAAESRAQTPPPTGQPRIAVLPFQVFSARPQGYLEQSLADLLTTRLEASGQVRVLEAATVRESVIAHAGERSEATLRRIAHDVGADEVVAGSLTELAGRYSLDVKVVPADEAAATRTLVFTAEGEPELLDRVNELADRVLEVAGGASAQGQIAEVRIEGVSEELAAELPKRLRLQRGAAYESSAAREDLRTLREVPGIAAADVDTERSPKGVIVTYRLVPAEKLIPASPLEKPGDTVADVLVRGNRRIEANAIKARVATKPGQPFNPATVASDVREIYGLGFFRNVRVLTEQTPKGRVLTFDVEENPVVRQVTITGNENIDSEKIRDTLTLTTGSTLDYPLLFENGERVEALYRADGYYLARVSHKIEELSGDAVSIDFEVNEGEKLPLDRIEFEGNEHFSQEDLEDSLKTKSRRWYSLVTKYLDKSGTYSEPVFIQDLQKINEKYTNQGYIQVEIGDPRVTVIKDNSGKDALVVAVEIHEGPEYRVGSVDVQGDPSLDLIALRERVRLKEGEIFNRSSLTADVEDLERYYTDRGFFYASVSPRTNLEESDLTVDVAFDVQKGDLHFIREIDVTGNTNTVDEVVRREMRVVEGQLYSARGVNRSRDRVKRLGFFEDVEFEAKATDYQEQLDLDLKVVERPTGSLSFGVGYSTQDSIVVSGSISQSNLFGRGYGVNAVIDYGSRNSQFYLSFYNPYLLGSEFSLRTTAFRTDLEYIDFQQTELGVEFGLGHDLNEEGTARGNLRYSYATRDIAAPHGRERRVDDLPRAALERQQHQLARALLDLRYARRLRQSDRRPRLRRQPRVRGTRRVRAVPSHGGTSALVQEAARLVPRLVPVPRRLDLRVRPARRLHGAVQLDLRLLLRRAGDRHRAGQPGPAARQHRHGSRAPALRALLPGRPGQLPAPRLSRPLGRPAAQHPAAQRRLRARQLLLPRGPATRLQRDGPGDRRVLRRLVECVREPG